MKKNREEDLGKIWYLKQINLLQTLNKEQMEYLASSCQMKEYKAKEMIYHPQEGENHIFFLKKGKVRLYRLDPNGKEFTMTILQEGESFGALANLFQDQQERLSWEDEGWNQEFAQALEATLVCFIPKRLFFEMTKDSPSLNLRLSKMLGLRLIEVSMLVEEIAFKSVIQRISSLLLRLYKKFGKEIKGERERVLSLSLTHYDLATMIGATREATTLALDKLKKLEAIEIRRKKIVLKNMDLLKEIQQGF